MSKRFRKDIFPAAGEHHSLLDRMILTVLLLFLIPGFSLAQGVMQQVGDTPIEFSYESWDIENYGQPDEFHRVSGNPASVTAYLEGTPVVLKAATMVYRSQEGLVSADKGVTISDGTFTVQAQKGSFNLTNRVAEFSGGTRFQKKAGEQVSWGESESLTIYLGDKGIERISASASSKFPGRLNLYPEKGALDVLPAELNKEKIPVGQEEQRARAPLEQ